MFCLGAFQKIPNTHVDAHHHYDDDRNDDIGNILPYSALDPISLQY